MLPPFLPFTIRPVRRSAVKRAVAAPFLREFGAVETPSIKAERLVLRPDRAPASGRLRVLDRG